MRVSEIRVKRIRVNQGLGVHSLNDLNEHYGHLWNFCLDVRISRNGLFCPKKHHLHPQEEFQKFCKKV